MPLSVTRKIRRTILHAQTDDDVPLLDLVIGQPRFDSFPRVLHQVGDGLSYQTAVEGKDRNGTFVADLDVRVRCRYALQNGCI